MRRHIFHQSAAARTVQAVWAAMMVVLPAGVSRTQPAGQTLPTAAVGTVDGEGTVSLSGGFAYTIPIALPSAGSGVTPEVSLDYDSGAGNGHLGVGWRIGGASAIERCPLDVRASGRRGPVPGTTDQYCLDGMRLFRTVETAYKPLWDHFTIPGYPNVHYSNEHSSDDTELFSYTVRDQPTLRATHHPKSGYWVVERGDGHLWVYTKAEVTGASVLDPAILRRHIDPNGATVVYHYDETEVPPDPDPSECEPGRPRLREIEYAGTLVSFEFGPRPEHLRGFNDSLRIGLTSLLTEIRIAHAGEELGSYRLGYEQGTATGRSRLASVRRCAAPAVGGAAPCMPPTRFTYTDKENGFEPVIEPVIPAPTASFRSAYRVGDFNGDGYDDIAVLVDAGAKSTEIVAAFGGADGLIASVPTESLVENTPFVLNSEPELPDAQGFWEVCDPNGDGRDDMVVQTAANRFEILGGRASTVSPYVWTSAGSKLAEGRDTMQFGACADFDGDGYDDVITCEGESAHELRYVVYRHTGFGLLEREATDLLCRSTAKQVFDVTDDGVPDVVDLGFSHLCGQAAVEDWADCLRATLPGPCDYEGDLNGVTVTGTLDGEPIECPLGNFVDYTTPSSTTVALTSGGTVGGSFRYIDPPVFFSQGLYKGGDEWTVRRSSLGTADINADGSPDLLMAAFYKEGGLLEARFGDGRNVSMRGLLDYLNEKNLAELALADWNSDGRTDVLVPYEEGEPIIRAFSWTIDAFESQASPFVPGWKYPVTMGPTAQEDTGVSYVGQLLVGDFNGDLMVDFLMCGGCTVEGTPSDRWVLYPSRPSLVRDAPVRAPPDLLAEIRTGTTATERVVYGSVADQQQGQYHCPDGDFCICPPETKCEIARHPVVHEHENAGLFRRRYTYRGLLRDRATGQDLGPAELEIVELRGAADSWVSVSEFDNDVYDAERRVFPFAGRPARTLLWQGAGPYTEQSRYTETTTAWSVRDTTTFDDAALHIDHGLTVWPEVTTVAICETDAPVDSAGELASLVPLSLQTTQVELDGYGRESDRTVTDGLGTTTTHTEYEDPVEPSTHITYHMFARVESVVEIRTAAGRPDRTRTVHFGYAGTKYGTDPEIVEVDRDDLLRSRVFEYERDFKGRLIAQTERVWLETPRETTFKWEACDGRFPSRVTNAAGHDLVYEWHCGLGVVLSKTDDNGVQARTTVDGFGRPQWREVTDIGGNSSGAMVLTSYERVLAGGSDVASPLRVRTTASEGSQTVVDLDPHGRPVNIVRYIDGTPSTVRIEYDDHGRRTAVSRPYFAGDPVHWWENIFDNHDRPVAVFGPAGFAQTFSYDGLASTQTDADGLSRTTELNVRGLPARVVLAEGTPDETSVCYRYGAADELLEVFAACDTPEEALLRRFEWDTGAHHVTQTDDASAGTSESHYNGYGELVSFTDPTQSATMTYNELGQLTSRTVLRADGTFDSATTLTYAQPFEPWNGPPGALLDVDHQINADYGLVQVPGAPGEPVAGPRQEVRYDIFGRPLLRRLQVDGDVFETSMSYDWAGRLGEMELPGPGAPRLSFIYDANGAVKRLNLEGATTTLWERGEVDAAGRALRETLGNGVERRTAYDDAGRPVALQSDDAWPVIAAWIPAVLQTSDRYEYSPGGRLLRHTDDATGQYEQFGYDHAGRISQELLSTVDDSVQTWWIHDYDAYGNFTSKAGTAIWATPGGLVQSAGDRAFSHDDAGRVIGIASVSAGGGFGVGGFDDLPIHLSRYATGEIAEVASSSVDVRYLRDGLGTRVKSRDAKAGRTTVELGMYSRITDKTGDLHRYEIPLGPHTVLVMDGEGLGAAFTTPGGGDEDGFAMATQVFVGTDLRGSPVARTNELGEILDRRSYGTFGLTRDPTLWSSAGTQEDDSAVGFTGMPAQTIGGLIDFGGRWLDPRSGTMLSPDPYIVDPLNPLTQNATMFGADPLTVDPSGFFAGPITPVDILLPAALGPLAGPLSLLAGLALSAIAGTSAHASHDGPSAGGGARRNEFQGWRKGGTPANEMSVAGTAAAGGAILTPKWRTFARKLVFSGLTLFGGSANPADGVPPPHWEHPRKTPLGGEGGPSYTDDYVEQALKKGKSTTISGSGGGGKPPPGSSRAGGGFAKTAVHASARARDGLLPAPWLITRDGVTAPSPGTTFSGATSGTRAPTTAAPAARVGGTSFLKWLGRAALKGMVVLDAIEVSQMGSDSMDPVEPSSNLELRSRGLRTDSFLGIIPYITKDDGPPAWGSTVGRPSFWD